MTELAQPPETFDFLGLPLEIQSYIIQIFCASEVYAPIFRALNRTILSTQFNPPVAILAVCRHFYHNFKRAVESGWLSRFRFDIPGTDAHSPHGERLLTMKWAFDHTIRSCYPPLTPSTAEGYPPPEWNLPIKLTHHIEPGTSFIKHYYGRTCRYDCCPLNPWRREVCSAIKRLDRFTDSPAKLLTLNFSKVERLDGAPYCKSLQQWRSMLPNLQVINFTVARITKFTVDTYLPPREIPANLTLTKLLDASNHDICARTIYTWFRQYHAFDKTSRFASLHEEAEKDPFNNISVTIASLWHLRRRDAWRHESYRFSIPGTYLIFHVNVQNGIPSVKRKEWRKHDENLPNYRAPVMPGVMFPQWEVDTYGGKIGMSREEKKKFDMKTYFHRWTDDDEKDLEVAQDIKAEMDRWANAILLPVEKPDIYSLEEIYDKRRSVIRRRIEEDKLKREAEWIAKQASGIAGVSASVSVVRVDPHANTAT